MPIDAAFSTVSVRSAVGELADAGGDARAGLQRVDREVDGLDARGPREVVERAAGQREQRQVELERQVRHARHRPVAAVDAEHPRRVVARHDLADDVVHASRRARARGPRAAGSRSAIVGRGSSRMTAVPASLFITISTPAPSADGGRSISSTTCSTSGAGEDGCGARREDQPAEDGDPRADRDAADHVGEPVRTDVQARVRHRGGQRRDHEARPDRLQRDAGREAGGARRVTRRERRSRGVGAEPADAGHLVEERAAARRRSSSRRRRRRSAAVSIEPIAAHGRARPAERSPAPPRPRTRAPRDRPRG